MLDIATGLLPTMMSEALKAAVAISSKHQFPEDVEGALCGEDILSQFCGFPPCVTKGGRLLVYGNNIIDALKQSAFRDTFFQPSYAIVSASKNLFDGSERNHESLSFEAVYGVTVEAMKKCDDKLGLVASSFDQIWLNSCPSECNLSSQST